MVDTLEFRVHNVSTYKTLVNLFYNDESGKMRLLSNPNLHNDDKRQSLTQWVINYDAKTATPLRKADKRRIVSSNNNITFYIDPLRDLLVFNLSLPKFLYGNNVMEYIPFGKYYNTKNYNPYNCLSDVFNKLPKLINEIAHILSNGVPISKDGTGVAGLSLNDVELYRVDVTFNQHFNSKQDAFDYLEEQYKILKKHQDVHAGSRRRFATTLECKTDRYYFKIYHKGSEFAHGQKKEIIKRNIEFKNNLHTNANLSARLCDELQETADKILRYEFTFRGNYLSYIYNRRVNKIWSHRWNDCKKMFDYYKNHPEELQKFYKVQEITEVYKPENYCDTQVLAQRKVYKYLFNGRFLTLPDTQVQHYKLMKVLIVKVTLPYIKSFMKFMEMELNKVRNFMLSTNEIQYHKDSHITEHGELAKNIITATTPQHQKFCRSLLKEMVKEMEQTFNTFQITSITPDDEFKMMVNDYEKRALENETIFSFTKKQGAIKGMYKRSIFEFHELVKKHTYDEIKAMNLYPKTTFYRLRKLYTDITGNKSTVSNLLIHTNKDFSTIMKSAHSQATFSELARFYHNAETFHSF